MSDSDKIDAQPNMGELRFVRALSAKIDAEREVSMYLVSDGSWQMTFERMENGEPKRQNVRCSPEAMEAVVQLWMRLATDVNIGLAV